MEKKRRNALIFIVFGAILLTMPLIGIAQIINNLNADLGDESFSTVVSGSIVLKDESGQVINPVIESSLVSGDNAVSHIIVTLGWATVGSEVDWSTFMITATPSIELDDPFGDTSITPRIVNYPFATSIFHEAVDGLIWDFDLQTEVIDVLGGDYLGFLTGVKFTFKAVLSAQVTDVYDGVHEETADVSASVILDWQAPTFSFTVSQSFTPSSVFGGGGVGDLAFMALGVIVIGFGFLLFMGKKIRLPLPKLK